MTNGYSLKFKTNLNIFFNALFVSMLIVIWTVGFVIYPESTQTKGFWTFGVILDSVRVDVLSPAAWVLIVLSCFLIAISTGYFYSKKTRLFVEKKNKFYFLEQVNHFMLITQIVIAIIFSCLSYKYISIYNFSIFYIIAVSIACLSLFVATFMFCIKIYYINKHKTQYFKSSLTEKFQTSWETNNKYKIKYMVLCGILMGTTLLANFIGDLFPIFGGFGIEIHVSIFILSLVLIKNKYYAWTYAILTPWIMAFVTGNVALNFADLMLEYVVPYYLFVWMIYFFNIWDPIVNKIKKKQSRVALTIIVFTICCALCVSVKLICSFTAGILWWAEAQTTLAEKAIFSITFNAPIMFGSFAICLPLLSTSIWPIYIFYKTDPFFNN